MKIPKPYFRNIPLIGDLDVDFIIFQADYPVLFTCKDICDNIYLCVCCEVREQQRWIVSPIKSSTIVGMLENKITLYDAFKFGNGKRYIITWEFESKVEDVKVVDFSDIDLLDLPVQGEYFEAEEHEFDDYIEKLEQSESLCKNSIISEQTIEYIMSSQKRKTVIKKWRNPEFIQRCVFSEARSAKVEQLQFQKISYKLCTSCR